MYANPLSLRIPSDSSFQFSCVANSGFFQRIVISQSGRVVATFDGVGEGVQMTQASGSNFYSGVTGEPAQFTLLFQHASLGSAGTYFNSTVTLDTTAGIVTTIATADSIEQDSLNMICTLVVAASGRK
jgi:hypothetical protein